MAQTIHNIPLINLTFICIPVLLTLFIYFKWSLKITRPLYAIGRMFLQLLLIGYFLTYIFAIDASWPIWGILTFMLVVSSWIVINNLSQPVDVSNQQLFKNAFIANMVGGALTLYFITQWVLNLDPWYLPQYMIPLAGMVFSNSMNSISLVAERFYSEQAHGKDYATARNIAFNASMIPTTNSLLAVGLVSLPGMMTGQILSGVDPLIATRYQIMVMLMIFGSAGISSALFLKLSQTR